MLPSFQLAAFGESLFAKLQSGKLDYSPYLKKASWKYLAIDFTNDFP